MIATTLGFTLPQLGEADLLIMSHSYNNGWDSGSQGRYPGDQSREQRQPQPQEHHHRLPPLGSLITGLPGHVASPRGNEPSHQHMGYQPQPHLDTRHTWGTQPHPSNPQALAHASYQDPAYPSAQYQQPYRDRHHSVSTLASSDASPTEAKSYHISHGHGPAAYPTTFDPHRQRVGPAHQFDVPPPPVPTNLDSAMGQCLSVDTDVPRRTTVSNLPNIFGADRAQAVATTRFSLRLRQQPRAARSCGFGDRDRRVIDPPPIVELVVDGPDLTVDEIRAYQRFETYIMTCSIRDVSGARDASKMPDDYKNQRRLMGQLVVTPFFGKDEDNNPGCFFTFSDLSCRTAGSFRLQFSLAMIAPANAAAVRHFPMVAEAISEIFTVYNAKDFPGMMPSSKLARRLREQGCMISIKKGSTDKAPDSKGSAASSDAEGESDDEAVPEPPVSSRGRGRRRGRGN